LNLGSGVAVGIGLVGKSLPVEAAGILLDMVKCVVVEIERAVAGCSVAFIPGKLRLGLGIHVNPDKTLFIDVDVEREQAVLRSVKARKILVERGLGKLSIHTIGPAVVFARQDIVLAIILNNDWEGSVTADIVEALDCALGIANEEEVEACFSIADPGASLLESHLVCKQDPFLGEDGSSFKFVDVVRLVPC
jgi:hypothetical protein